MFRLGFHKAVRWGVSIFLLATVCHSGFMVVLRGVWVGRWCALWLFCGESGYSWCLRDFSGLYGWFFGSGFLVGFWGLGGFSVAEGRCGWRVAWRVCGGRGVLWGGSTID